MLPAERDDDMSCQKMTAFSIFDAATTMDIVVDAPLNERFFDSYAVFKTKMNSWFKEIDDTSVIFKNVLHIVGGDARTDALYDCIRCECMMWCFRFDDALEFAKLAAAKHPCFTTLMVLSDAYEVACMYSEALVALTLAEGALRDSETKTYDLHWIAVLRRKVVDATGSWCGLQT
jgi:hypothetical protein